jgi:hypothetical protein
MGIEHCNYNYRLTTMTTPSLGLYPEGGNKKVGLLHTSDAVVHQPLTRFTPLLDVEEIEELVSGSSSSEDVRYCCCV